ncbi:transcriptional repressor LexA [Tepidimonas sp.]|uniref:transcriptional repressor LexA n=1 Tax=Tepidimonas sp. TaxID=2002775 RepID=UPI002FDF106D
MDERRPTAAESAAAMLTPRQREILAFIGRALQERGLPPTRAEIAATFGFRSPNAAQAHLLALARKGMLELLPGSARGIRLLVAAAGASRGADGVNRVPLDAEAPGAGAAGGAAADAAPRASAHGQPRTTAPQGARGGGRVAPRGGGDAVSAQGAQRASADGLRLPLIGRVAAGSPMLAQAHVEAVYVADPRWFARRPDYLLRVRGWSMRDAGILDGDLVAVQAVREARPGQVVVARLGEEVTVKRLQRHGRGWRLQAANPDVPDIVVQPGEDLVIEGVVVGLLRPHGWL